MIDKKTANDFGKERFKLIKCSGFTAEDNVKFYGTLLLICNVYEKAMDDFMEPIL